MKSLSLTIRWAIGIGGLALFLVGWQLGGGEAPARPGASSSEEAGKLSSREARPYGKYRTPDHANSRVAAIRSLPTAGEQMRATIALVESLSLAELADWLEGRWFAHGGDYNLVLFNKLAEKRWQAEDADGYLAWQLRQGSAYDTIGSLIHSDPQWLVSYFRDQPDRKAELGMLGRLAGQRPALVLSRLRELLQGGMAMDNSTRRQLGSLLQAVAAADPSGAADLRGSLPADLSASLEQGLLARAFEDSPEATLRDLWGRADGWSRFSRLPSELAGEQLLALAGELPSDWKALIASQSHRAVSSATASRWLSFDFHKAGFTDDQAESIVSRAVHYVARDHPALALEKLNQWVTGENRANTLRSLAFSMPVDQAKEILAGIESEDDRQTVAKVLEGRQERDAKPARPAAETPDEWFDQLSGAGGSSWSVARQVSDWPAEERADLVNAFAELPDEAKTSVSESLLGNVESVDPALGGAVIRHLLERAGDEEGRDNAVSEASRLAVTWMKNDPGAASQWVNSLPAGDGKLWVQKNLARNWALYDPDASRQWVGSLSAGARAEVEAYLEEKR